MRGYVIVGIALLGLGVGISAAIIENDHIAIFEAGESEYTLVMPADSGNGRRVFIEGISLTSTGGNPRGHKDHPPAVQSVIIPRTMPGRVEVTVRRVPDPAAP